MTITRQEIDALTLTEKKELLDMIWDSMNINHEEEYVDDEEEESEEELAILRERLEDYRKNPSSAIPLDEAFERLRKRI